VTQDVRSDPGGLVPGEQLAGYQIQEQIGRGGMAVVYRALDLRLGRVVALKVLAPHLGEDEAFRQRFIRESRAAAGVDHPHIIPVFEAGEAGGVLFIAMRYVGHGDVRSLIDTEGRLTPARTAAIVAQAASALDAAHAYGLVHRDVKPGNILLALASDDSDHVYLSDFGLSKDSVNPSTLTSTGQFLGTLDYVSPEQIQGHPVDGRADQYALACTAVEMLTGAPPFRNDDSMAVMWAQLESEPPRVTQRRPDLSPAVDEVIAAAMAKSPASRYQTCRDFALALGAACEQSPRTRTAAAEIRAPWPDDNERADHRADHRAGFGQAGPERAARPVPVTGWDGPVPGRIDPVSYAAREPARLPRSPGTPAEFAGRASATPGRQAGNMPGTWPPQPRVASPARSRRRTHRGRNITIAVLVVLVGLAGVAGIAYKLAHRQDGAAPSATAAHSGSAAGQRPPAQIVREYFNAINQHRYKAAWQLRKENESLAKFKAGYASTARDTVRIIGHSGDVVTAKLIALQTDGTVKTYEGTYTVTGGIISSTDVHQLSGPVTS
jgi:Protein kinase domain